MKIQVTATATALGIEIGGEVDVYNRDTLKAALAVIDFEAADAVILDLRQLSFCDTAGCWALLVFEREARLSGTTNVRGATSTVRWLLSFLADGDPLTFV